MIQIYKPSNTNFEKNGDAVLQPISCQVTAEINGAWMLELVMPIDDEDRWKLLEVGAVIKAPSFNGDQLFRIRQTEKQDSGLTALAEPIFMDAVGEVFLMDRKIINKTGQQALDDIFDGTNYTASSDIAKVSTAYYVRKNALEAIAGEEDNSFLNRWGGEILFNNKNITINNQIGQDRGVRLLYGKNIPVDGLKETINMDEVTTRIVPKAYNGHILPGSAPWVDSPLIGVYPTVLTRLVEYDNIRLAIDVEGEEPEAGVIVCESLDVLYDELRAAANRSFDAGIDKPAVSIEADMVLLGNTIEYQDFKQLEEVSLGDTIHLKHSRLGIESSARVIGLTFDCIRKAVSSVVIGEAQPTFMDRVATTVQATEKAITKAGAVKAEKLEGFIDGTLAQLRIQNTIARRQEARAILFEDLDTGSPTFGALSIGTQGWQISKERNADNTDWVWTTAATSGGIIADAIKTGTLEAVDINGVNISGSTITGTDISGSTFTSINSGGTDGIRITGGAIHVYYRENYAGKIYSSSKEESGVTTYGLALSGQNGRVLAGPNITFDSEDSFIWVGKKGDNTHHIRLSPANDYMYIRNGNIYGYYYADKINLSDGTNTGLYYPDGWRLAGSGLVASGTNRTITAYNTATPDTIYVRMDADNKRLVVRDGTKNARVYPNEIVIADGSTMVWKSQYDAGDEMGYGTACFAGHVTNASKWIEFFVPMNISPKGRTVAITLPSQFSVRGVNGYVGGSQYPTWNVTATCNQQRNGVLVRLASTTAFTNVTNNTPVTVHGDFTFTFS